MTQTRTINKLINKLLITFIIPRPFRDFLYVYLFLALVNITIEARICNRHIILDYTQL
jgi:hypothetical protein